MGDRLAGKVAVVTGAARGTGAVVAARLAAEGARVVAVDVLDDRGRDVVAAIGDAARYVHCDVSDEQDWADTIRAARAFGGLDVLVNNAAVLQLSGIEDTTVAACSR
jgi:3alpha(or 20beta)-hydroxysteroid dehydrogenase